jgi:hypothetical protein
MAQQEDLYLIVGELYVAQRMLQDASDKLAESNNQMRIDSASLQEQLDAATARVEVLEADIELLEQRLERKTKRKGGKA